MSKGADTIKNRYYLVTKDGVSYAYLSVKKDFYTEGYLIEQNAVLIGYFNMYRSLDVHVINDCKNHLNGLSIIPKYSSTNFDVSGRVDSNGYQLYRANLDEYCSHILGEQINGEIQIKQIIDDKVIQDINYLVRSNLRKLTGINKQYYEMLKSHRYGNLKEVLSGMKFFLDNGTDLGISSVVINDLEQYLKTLNPNINSDKQKEFKRKVKKKNSRKK